MSDKITIPAVAYQAMETQLRGARQEEEHARRILETKAYWKAHREASAKVDRLTAQLDRFEPEPTDPPGTNGAAWAADTVRAAEEQKDATSSPAENEATAAGQVASGGATEIPRDAPGTNGDTWANDTARAAENRAGPPSPRATDDTLGELPECLDVTKRERA